MVVRLVALVSQVHSIPVYSSGTTDTRNLVLNHGSIEAVHLSMYWPSIYGLAVHLYLVA